MMSFWCSTVIRTRDPGSKPAVSIHRPESFIHGKVAGSLRIWKGRRAGLAKCEWTHIMRDGAVRRELLQQFLRTIETTDFLIRVRRKRGDFLPLADAMDFVCESICKGFIRITDRQFQRFVIVASNGVAATWPISSEFKGGAAEAH
jgi:hypothetical protein